MDLSSSHLKILTSAAMSVLIFFSLILSTGKQIEFYDLLKTNALASEYWKIYKSHYNLKFNEFEDSDRKEIFVKNLLQIEAHNRKNVGFKMQMNEFGHLTDEEFKGQYLSRTTMKFTPKSEKIPVKKSITSVDWRTKNVVNGIRSQGDCNAGYAFSAISSVESAIAIKTGKLLQLSEQDLVDCSYKNGNAACRGGYTVNSFVYIMSHGITSGDDYKYIGFKDDCHQRYYPIVANISSYVEIDFENETQLTEVVSTKQPVSALIVASAESFRFYKSGIYYEPKCKDLYLNHFVTVVGVTDEYYIVRNSWGTSWGDKGYIYMARNKNNNCGIASGATYPVV